MLSFTILNWKTKFLRCYHKSWHYNYYVTSIKFLSLYIIRVGYCWPFIIVWYEVLFFDRMFACFRQWMSNMLCVIFINKEYIKYYAHFCFDPVSWMREVSIYHFKYKWCFGSLERKMVCVVIKMKFSFESEARVYNNFLKLI